MKKSRVLNFFVLLSILLFALFGSKLTPKTVFAQTTDPPGYSVIPTTSLITDEGGQIAQFTINLTAAPIPFTQVSISLQSSDEGEGQPSPTSLTFTATDWDIPRTVTVTGQNDHIVDGSQNYSIQISLTSSSDPVYLVIDPPDVNLINLDDDNADIVVDPVSGLITDEGGLTAQFTISLTAAPTTGNEVTIALLSSDPGEGQPSPTSLTFTATDWNIPQTVTVTGQNDDIDDNDQNYIIQTELAVSGDPAYAGVNPPDVSLTNIDNDTAGFTVAPLSGLTTDESGLEATFTVRLNSRPAFTVTVNLVSSDTTEGTVSPPTLEFTPGNWNTEQTATLTGVDDTLFDDTISYSIETTASSSDPAYNGNPPDVSAQNLDNEEEMVTAQPDNYSLTQNLPFTVPAPGVLANDITNNGTLTAQKLSDPLHGAVAFSANGGFVYDPIDGYVGSDSFTYRAWNNDGITFSDTTVSLAVNLQITVTVQPDFYITGQNNPLNQAAPGVLDNDDTNSGELTAELVTPTQHGSVTLNGNGSFLYTPVPTFTGNDTFTYRARNTIDTGISATSTVTITVSQTIQTIAQADEYTTSENVPLTVPVPGVLANDTTNNGTLTAALVTTVAHGTLALQTNGSFVYTPAPNYVGPDSFTYRAISVPSTVPSPPTLVELTVTLTNNPPTAANDSYLTNATSAVPYSVSAPGLLANDTDPENSLLTATLLGSASVGSVVLNSNGAFTFTPPPGFNGQATFNYQITDAGSKTSTASVTIQVDTVVPEPITWVSPDVIGSITLFSRGSVRLEVQVDPGDTDVARVVFYRWDPVTSQRYEIGSSTTSPYVITIDATSLRFEWNQIDAAAIDHAGNRSALRHIWVLREFPPVAFFPIMFR